MCILIDINTSKNASKISNIIYKQFIIVIIIVRAVRYILNFYKQAFYTSFVCCEMKVLETTKMSLLCLRIKCKNLLKNLF